LVITYDPIKERIKLAKLVGELSPKKDIKTRSKIKRIALELAKRRKQVIYGSAVSSVYARKIHPKDIDISAEQPKEAAKILQRKLAKKGIRRKIKEKYIKKIRRKIYGIGGVSYSPLTKRKLGATVEINKRKTTALQEEVLALSSTITEPTAQFRAKKDLSRLNIIAKKLKKEKRKEFEDILRKLRFEAVARTYLYSERKAKRLRKQKVFFQTETKKYKKTYPKLKQGGFI